VGIAGTVLAGPISDRFFGSRRAPVTFAYGVLLIISLLGIYYSPPGQHWLIRCSMGSAGFAIGGLLVFLGGLAAMDICSKRTSGAALGFIGGFSYIGAATQDWISGSLIEASRTVHDGTVIYDFTNAKIFWIGAACLSLILACTLWRAEKRNEVLNNMLYRSDHERR
jgi:OPA family sugar phosphate sensor protein UhpC-like MFS transporter